MPRIRSETPMASESDRAATAGDGERGATMTTHIMQHAHQGEISPAVLPSRRDVLCRLAALGLAAAAGAALTPLDGGAKGAGKGRGRGKHHGRGHGQDKGNDKGHGPDGDEHDVPAATAEGAGRRGGKGRDKGVNAELNLPDLPDPVVRATLTIGSRTNADTYLVTVSGSIGFDAELLALMQRGRQFRLECELWNLDDNDLIARRAFIPLASGVQNFTATNGRTFRFADYVSRDKLNEDTPSGCIPLFGCTNSDDTDEVIALLRLKTRRNSAVPTWKAAFREANHRDYYLTNQVARVF